MTIKEIIERRKIEEIVHFTTNRGLTGIIHSEALSARSIVKDDRNLEYILSLNTEVRKDPHWEGYVNLSISGVNSSFFGYSQYSIKSKADWWCVLSFTPSILEHDGVIFATGNNTWPDTKRRSGPEGLEALFASRIPGRYKSTVFRSESQADCQPTCDQAEVLYPGRVMLEHLKCIYVESHEVEDQVLGMLDALDRQFNVIVSKKFF